MNRDREPERTAVNRAIKLPQGRSSSKQDKSYKGDAAMCSPMMVTVQVHKLTVDDPDIKSGVKVAAVAVHIPPSLVTDDVMVQG
jgi:hypothetical protein